MLTSTRAAVAARRHHHKQQNQLKQFVSRPTRLEKQAVLAPRGRVRQARLLLSTVLLKRRSRLQVITICKPRLHNLLCPKDIPRQTLPSPQEDHETLARPPSMPKPIWALLVPSLPFIRCPHLRSQTTKMVGIHFMLCLFRERFSSLFFAFFSILFAHS